MCKTVHIRPRQDRESEKCLGISEAFQKMMPDNFKSGPRVSRDLIASVSRERSYRNPLARMFFCSRKLI